MRGQAESQYNASANSSQSLSVSIRHLEEAGIPPLKKKKKKKNHQKTRGCRERNILTNCRVSCKKSVPKCQSQNVRHGMFTA